VVSFTPCPRYHWQNLSHYLLKRSLGGSRSLSGCFGEETNLLSLPRIEPKFFGYIVWDSEIELEGTEANNRHHIYVPNESGILCYVRHSLHEYADRGFSRALAIISHEIEMELIISAVTTAVSFPHNLSFFKSVLEMSRCTRTQSQY
jgi:hypothetical protein